MIFLVVFLIRENIFVQVKLIARCNVRPETTQFSGICVIDKQHEGLWIKSDSAQFVKYAKISFEIQFEEKFGAARTPGAPLPQTRQIQVAKSQNNKEHFCRKITLHLWKASQTKMMKQTIKMTKGGLSLLHAVDSTVDSTVWSLES